VSAAETEKMGDRRKLLASEFTKHRRLATETTRRKRKTAQTGGDSWSEDKLPGFTRESVARILFTACQATTRSTDTRQAIRPHEIISRMLMVWRSGRMALNFYRVVWVMTRNPTLLTGTDHNGVRHSLTIATN